MTIRIQFLGGLILLATSALRASAGEKTVDYNFDVRPILADRCFLCHGPDERARKADLRLDQAKSAYDSGAIVPGKPEESELVRRISAHDDEQMPPKKSNLTLAPGEIELLRKWVAEGAEYKPHWAFLPLPAEVKPPGLVSTPGWVVNPIDSFVLARLDRERLQPSPPASRTDWLRRVSFDLTGLPPSLADVDAFLNDSSPQAFEAVVDRLLDSPRFGERMAMEWLDVARYADSFGYQADGDTNVWPWRDWVIRAFNSNLRYDQFLTWQVAGDLLPNATRDQRLATAFNRLNRMTNEGGSIPEEWRNEYVSDRVHTVGTAFLAVTMECTRCHDHKYDPLSMKDYYSLGAFFNSIDEWGTYDSAGFRPTPTLRLPTAEQERQVAERAEVLGKAEKTLDEAIRSREPAFQEWLGRSDLKAEIPGLGGHYPLDRIEPANKLANQAEPKTPGSTSPANTLDSGKTGQSLRFTGDDPAEFPGTPAKVERSSEFTIAFWLKLPDVPTSEMIFHRTAGTDTGFHGVELKFVEGKLHFALIRFWPGDAVAVQTRGKFPAKTWVHVAIAYDGSGKASGVRLFLDGNEPETEVVRDHLTKNIEVSGSGFVFGERFRSPGLKGGQVDEIRTYGRSLTPIEVRQLLDGKALAEAIARKDSESLRSYYLSAIDSEISRARLERQKAREQLFNAETAVFEVMTMAETAKPRPSYILARGNYDAPKDRPAGRGTPSFLPPYPPNAPRDRLGLARWMTDPNHPLTARVAVNRYWQLVFGRGIVATTENFGSQGALPTHPDLLDWLAREFVRSGWSVKKLLKTMVLSATYRQRSSAPESLRERDPHNLLHARGPSLRLPAEMLRDSALAVSGLLVEKVGGPPVKPYQPPGLWRGQNAFLPDYTPDKGEGAYRRSLYTFWRRTSPPPNMLAFDAPSREVCVVRRQSTSTPLQPLVLLNDPQFVDAAIGLGERMLREGGKSPRERLTYGFRLAATRMPSERELEILAGLYQQQLDQFRAEPERARKFLASAQHPLTGGLDSVELGSSGVIAGVILNLDASIATR